MNKLPSISIVIPLLNEENNLGKLHEEITSVVNPLFSYYEIIFVDDGSTDSSFEKIRDLAITDSHVNGISFSRNFGHQVALMAGMEHSSGELVLTMDSDLQHPPSLVPRMTELISQGYDVVNTVRTETEGIGKMKDYSSGFFYTLLNRISGLGIKPGSADFRLMNRKVVDAFLSLPERDRFTRGLISWMGFRQTELLYKANSRFTGVTKYSSLKMMKFALDGITSFSARPLRVSFYIGLVTLLLGIVYGIFIVIGYFRGATIQGWTSLILVVLFLGGTQLLSLGIIGEYIARIFNEAKARPLYLIKEKTGQKFSAH